MQTPPLLDSEGKPITAFTPEVITAYVEMLKAGGIRGLRMGPYNPVAANHRSSQAHPDETGEKKQPSPRARL